jgi:predicted Fe-Mo cluster-binding NifX family protein
MKIAIPTRNNQVDDHFGHCEYYTIVSLTPDNKVENSIIMESPQGCGCKSDIASTFQQMGVKTMLAGNMGQGAVNKITSAGIKVVRGCSGDVNKLIEDYLNNKINDSGLTCDHHGHQHESDSGHNCQH